MNARTRPSQWASVQLFPTDAFTRRGTIKSQNPFHDSFHPPGRRFDLLRRDFEDQFVMHGQSMAV